MAHNSANVHVFSTTTYGVYVAPLGTALPQTITAALPQNLDPAFNEVGLIDASGVTEGRTVNEQQIFDMAGSLIRIARNQEARQWTFSAMEIGSDIVNNLRYPSSTVTLSGGTSTVQTVTVTGTPTGGTYTLTAGGSTTANIGYNVTASVLATRLSALPGMVGTTVTGSTGGPYTVTFPLGASPVAAMTAASNLTGGSSPGVTVSVGTAGTASSRTRPVGSGTGFTPGCWVVNLYDGNFAKVVTMAYAEAVPTGTTTYSSSGAAVQQFNLNPYLDGNGNFYTVLD